MRLISTTLYALSLLGLALASNVIDLDTKNFEQIVGGSKPALVEFFAPWCGHCKNLAPTYEQLADAFPSDKVVIAKTDADGVGKELGNRFGVTGFPTLKWFPAGSLQPQDYTGGRDLDSLAGFVAKESGVKSKIKPPPPPAAVQLDASNFDKIALDQDKDVLVAFTAPWCGHCKNMKPAYENVARAFASEPSVVVAQMNADDEQNKPIAGNYDVHSFPTIKLFPKGGADPVMYSSGRTEEQFINFLNDNCGTFRTPGGSLSVSAGKVLTLDTLAQNFFTADLPGKPKILKEAQDYLTGLGSEITSSVNSSADYYVKAMQRILDKGEGWLTKEQARIAGLLQSPSLAPTKLDELRIKANILSSFAEQKAEEIADAAGDMFGEGAENVKAFVDMMEEQGAKATQKIKEEL